MEATEFLSEPISLARDNVRRGGRPFGAYSNEEGAPYGLSTADVLEELAKPAAEQRVKVAKVRFRPEGEEDLYELWRSVSIR